MDSCPFSVLKLLIVFIVFDAQIIPNLANRRPPYPHHWGLWYFAQDPHSLDALLLSGAPECPRLICLPGSRAESFISPSPWSFSGGIYRDLGVSDPSAPRLSLFMGHFIDQSRKCVFKRMNLQANSKPKRKD